MENYTQIFYAKSIEEKIRLFKQGLEKAETFEDVQKLFNAIPRMRGQEILVKGLIKLESLRDENEHLHLAQIRGIISQLFPDFEDFTFLAQVEGSEVLLKYFEKSHDPKIRGLLEKLKQ